MEIERIADKLDELLRGQATMVERVGNLCISVDVDRKENKDDHKIFYGDISDIKGRLLVMERVDDPEAVSSSTRYKVLWDILRIGLPILLAALFALKMAGKL